MMNENTHINFQQRLALKLKDSLNCFIESIDSDICLYGLNVSIYLEEKSEINNVPNYRVFSFYYSEVNHVYSKLWEEYLSKYGGKFSKFDNKEENDKGMYEKVTFFQTSKNSINTQREKLAEAKYEHSITAKSDEIVKRFDDTNFIHIEDGWLAFLKDIKDPPFNMQWTYSYLHNSSNIAIDYSKWYVSFYFLASHPNYRIENEDIIRNEIQPYINRLVTASSVAFYELLVEEKQKEIIRQSTQSAKTAIMGRNMSHNLGSHVIYYLRQHLSGDISKMTELFRDIVFNNSTDEVEMKIGDHVSKIPKATFDKLDLPFLKGLGSFLTYLQERQDYIAAISSEHNPAFGSANFKSFIIDNFTKDLRALRHNSSKKEDNILLKYIAKSENTEVVIKFNDHDLSQTIESNGHELHKFFVDLPGITLGRQAFYSILENIIRNAAKHGKRDNNDTKLEIDIRISENYNLTENQNKFFTTKDEESLWKSEHYQVRISENNVRREGLDNTLRDFLKENLIDDSGALIENHKGIKEIFISALWLNGINVTDIPADDRLKYIDVEYDEKNRLNYVLYLQKSRKMLLIKDKVSIDDWGTFGAVSLDEYFKNTNKASRYEIVVDLSLNGKIENDPNTHNIIRRYLKLNPKDELPKAVKDYFPEYKNITSVSGILINDNEDLKYVFFYHWYIWKKWFEESKRSFPSFKINITEKTNEEISGAYTSNTRYLDLFDKDKSNKMCDSLPFYYDASDSSKIIAFRRHIHDKPTEFFREIMNFDNVDSNHYLELINKTHRNYASVESITGDNSSFRIINNDEKDDLWVLRKIEASVAKILIIDERLWDNYVFAKDGSANIDSLQKVILGMFNVEVHKTIMKNVNWEQDRLYYEKLIDDIWKNDPDGEVLEKLCVKEKDRDSAEFKVKNLSPIDIKTKLNNCFDKQKPNAKQAVMNHLKNIVIANLQKERNALIDDFRKEIAKYENGKFSFNNNGKAVHFDYISIHQGIIDKLYSGTEDKTNQSKEIISKIRKAFGNPKVIVHTGRGKPNYIKDVAPYRSLSDLDYALNEPKEILMDYFNSATYES